MGAILGGGQFVLLERSGHRRVRVAGSMEATSLTVNSAADVRVYIGCAMAAVLYVLF